MNKTCPRGLRLAITLSRGQKMKISCPKGGFRTCSSIGGLRIFNAIAHYKRTRKRINYGDREAWPISAHAYWYTPAGRGCSAVYAEGLHFSAFHC